MNSSSELALDCLRGASANWSRPCRPLPYTRGQDVNRSLFARDAFLHARCGVGFSHHTPHLASLLPCALPISVQLSRGVGRQAIGWYVRTGTSSRSMRRVPPRHPGEELPGCGQAARPRLAEASITGKPTHRRDSGGPVVSWLSLESHSMGLLLDGNRAGRHRHREPVARR